MRLSAKGIAAVIVVFLIVVLVNFVPNWNDSVLYPFNTPYKEDTFSLASAVPMTNATSIEEHYKGTELPCSLRHDRYTLPNVFHELQEKPIQKQV